MAKIIVFTDIHIRAEGQRIIGLDPAARFAQGLAHAARLHPDAACAVLMGDLADTGVRAEYEILRRILADAPWPVIPMMGNHDNREVFRQVFPEAPRDPNGFVQAVRDLEGGRLITLDTLDPSTEPHHGGRLCSKRLDWLKAALAQAQGQGCLVFLHHPPFDTGFAGMDRIGLHNAAELRDLLASGPVTHVFAGHIHRTITATVDGLPMTVFKSPCHQMPMMLGAEGSGHSVPEPGAYGILTTRGPNVVVHFEDFTLPETAVGQSAI